MENPNPWRGDGAPQSPRAGGRDALAGRITVARARGEGARAGLAGPDPAGDALGGDPGGPQAGRGDPDPPRAGPRRGGGGAFARDAAIGMSTGASLRPSGICGRASSSSALAGNRRPHTASARVGSGEKESRSLSGWRAFGSVEQRRCNRSIRSRHWVGRAETVDRRLHSAGRALGRRPPAFRPPWGERCPDGLRIRHESRPLAAPAVGATSPRGRRRPADDPVVHRSARRGRAFVDLSSSGGPPSAPAALRRTSPQ